MMLLQTIVAFLVAIGLLVLVHELGHYLVARLCNVKVVRFSLGLGKALFSRRFGKDQTEWVISMLPIGGYVVMLNAQDQDLGDLPEEELKREFNNQPVWRRMAIVLAGAVANFIFGILILTAVNLHGIEAPSTKLRTVPEQSIAWQAGLRGGEYIVAINGEPVRIWSDLRWRLAQAILGGKSIQLDVSSGLSPFGSKTSRTVTIPQSKVEKIALDRHFASKLGFDVERPPAVLQKVVPGGLADLAGLQEGDQILFVNGRRVIDALAFVEMIGKAPGEPKKLIVLRGNKHKSFFVTPQLNPESDQKVGKIGVAVSVQAERTFVQEPFFSALNKAFAKTGETIFVSVKMIGKMIVGDVSLKSFSGPISIADYAGKTARLGVTHYLSFLAFISISIGVMNLLPIPVLDGGLLLYYSMELLTGRKITKRAGKIAQYIGLTLLAALMLMAVFNDIVRLFFGAA